MLVDHVETIGPTGPEGVLAGSRGTPEPTSAQHQKQSSGHRGRMITRIWWDSGESGTDTPTIWNRGSPQNRGLDQG